MGIRNPEGRSGIEVRKMDLLQAVKVPARMPLIPGERKPSGRPGMNKYKYDIDMKNHETPKPGSENYPVDHPQDLTKPKFRSGGQKTDRDELPPVENLNDLEETQVDSDAGASRPRTDLGNERDDEEEKNERIISR